MRHSCIFPSSAFSSLADGCIWHEVGRRVRTRRHALRDAARRVHRHRRRRVRVATELDHLVALRVRAWRKRSHAVLPWPGGLPPEASDPAGRGSSRPQSPPTTTPGASATPRSHRSRFRGSPPRTLSSRSCASSTIRSFSPLAPSSAAVAGAMSTVSSAVPRHAVGAERLPPAALSRRRTSRGEPARRSPGRAD